MLPRTPEIEAIYDKLGVGNGVMPRQLSSWVCYNITPGASGSGKRIFNPLSLSRLTSTLAVANCDPVDVQR